jgi:hypothetical protein
MADLLPVHALVNGSVILHYFRSSDVYGETGGLGAKVGIKKVANAALTGKETIIPVKELIRSGDMQRIAIGYKDSAGKRKTGRVLINRLNASKVFGDVAADKLEGVVYKVATKTKGTIDHIGQIRRATTY